MRSRPRSVGVNRLNQYASRITGQTEEKLFTVVFLQDVVKGCIFYNVKNASCPHFRVF